jgi:hypothetical protein
VKHTLHSHRLRGGGWHQTASGKWAAAARSAAVLGLQSMFINTSPSMWIVPRYSRRLKTLPDYLRSAGRW